MDISGEYRIPAERERVWAALNDPAVLKRCIPGCEEIEQTGDNEMQARITAKIGPVKARFRTRLSIENQDPPSSYRLAGEAKAGASGFGRGHADVTLAETDDGTVLGYRADFKVGGKLAQVGSRLVTGATRKTADEFFGNLSAELGGPSAGQAADGSDETGDSGFNAMPWWLAGAGVAVLLILWILLG